MKSMLKNYNFIDEFYELEKENHWDYLGKKDKPIDKIATYPAKMVSDMQGEIISEIMKEVHIKSIFDPFMGSGTILTEALFLGIEEILGNDINPLSYLIVKVKTFPLDDSILIENYKNLVKKIKEEKLLKNRYFPKITKWFSIEVIHQLSKIINEIEKIENNDIKDFFKLGFANLVKEVSNTRSSTFKLHIKSEIIIFKNCLEKFKKIIEKQIKSCTLFWKNIKKSKVILFNKDIRELEYKKKVDLIITSPPYGDNKTTVTYGEFSVLQLKWLGEEKYTETFSKIDTVSLGGNLQQCKDITTIESYNLSKELKIIVNKILKQTDYNKAKKVVVFIQDFYITLKKLYVILKKNGLLILTVGNRKVNNNEIKFNKIINELANKIGLNKIQEFSRNIPTSKKIAVKTSRLANGKSVNSINKEYILIFKK